MKLQAFLACIVVLGNGTVGFGQARSAPSTTIVPASAVGPFRIGMAVQGAKSAMRAFGGVRNVSDNTSLGYCNASGVGVCLYDENPYLTGASANSDSRVAVREVRTPGRVLSISTNDPRFRVAGGLGVGSSVADFIEKFGEPLFATPPRQILAEEYKATGALFGEWPSAGIGVLAQPSDGGPSAGQRVTLTYLRTVRVVNVSVYARR